MTETKTKKKAALLARARIEPIMNRDELAAVAIVTARLTIERDSKIIGRDEALAAIKEEYALDIEDMEDQIDNATKRMRAWALANRDEFGERQSLAVAGHELAFRKSPGQVAYAPGMKEADVLDGVLALDEDTAERLTTVKVALDKKAALKLWASGPDGQALLRSLGVEVIHPEEFTFKPDREAANSAPVKPRD